MENFQRTIVDLWARAVILMKGMKMNLQKMGGIAAMIEAATFVVGFALFFGLLNPADYGSLDGDPMRHVVFLVENAALMYAWNLIIYVIFGIFLVVLTLALNERLKADSPALAQTATAFGLIWAGLVIASGMVANVGAAFVVEVYNTQPSQAVSAWMALRFVVNGLGGGNEVVGGLWVLLLSVAALRGGALPKALNYSGMVIGAAGLVTTVPALTDVGAIFGLGFIPWFIWLGIVLLRK